MKVLVACEFSGTVRDEFLKLGHDAVSCDLLPSMSDKGRHIQGDVMDVISAEKWDLMIAHPPCTYLTIAANRAFKEDPTREREREGIQVCYGVIQCRHTEDLYGKSDGLSEYAFPEARSDNPSLDVRRLCNEKDMPLVETSPETVLECFISENPGANLLQRKYAYPLCRGITHKGNGSEKMAAEIKNISRHRGGNGASVGQ